MRLEEAVKQKWQALAKARGLSLTEFIERAVELSGVESASDLVASEIEGGAAVTPEAPVTVGEGEPDVQAQDWPGQMLPAAPPSHQEPGDVDAGSAERTDPPATTDERPEGLAARGILSSPSPLAASPVGVSKVEGIAPSDANAGSAPVAETGLTCCHRPPGSWCRKCSKLVR